MGLLHVLKYADPTEPVAEDDWEVLDNSKGEFMRSIDSLERAPILEVSADQEIVIPASVIDKMGIQPGQKFILIASLDSIRLMPLVSPQDVRGSLPGLDIAIDREDDEERTKISGEL